MTEAPDMSAIWQGMLTGSDTRYRNNRRFFKHVPGTPRCLFCAAPFGGPFAPLVRASGSTVRACWAGSCSFRAACAMRSTSILITSRSYVIRPFTSTSTSVVCV